jgi:hypothetical protein
MIKNDIDEIYFYKISYDVWVYFILFCHTYIQLRDNENNLL